MVVDLLAKASATGRVDSSISGKSMPRGANLDAELTRDLSLIRASVQIRRLC